MVASFLPSKRPIASAKSGNEPLPVRTIHRDLNDREQYKSGNTDPPVRSKPAIGYASGFGNALQSSLDPSVSAGNSNIVLSHFFRKLETGKQGICNTKRLLGKRPNPLNTSQAMWADPLKRM